MGGKDPLARHPVEMSITYQPLITINGSLINFDGKLWEHCVIDASICLAISIEKCTIYNREIDRKV